MDRVFDKYGRELKIGDKFKRDHGIWKDKYVFTVEDFDGCNVLACEDSMWSLCSQVYKIEPNRYIVVVEKNGKLSPAANPKEHKTLSEARDVAENMAKKHEAAFYVLKAVAVSTPNIVKTVEVVTEVFE